jgi:hypothetical protein
VLLNAIYVCEIYNLCYVCDTLYFVRNGIFVIQNMCLMNTSNKEPKKYRKQLISSGFFIQRVAAGLPFSGPVISTDLPVISAGLLVSTGF